MHTELGCAGNTVHKDPGLTVQQDTQDAALCAVSRRPGVCGVLGCTGLGYALTGVHRDGGVQGPGSMMYQ